MRPMVQSSVETDPLGWPFHLQVKHLVEVETDHAFAARKAAEAAARAHREPVRVSHHVLEQPSFAEH